MQFLWFGLSVDSFSKGFHPIPASYASQLVAIALAGFFVGCTPALFMELAAEVTYPIPAGFSSNSIALMINVTNVLALGIFPYLSSLLVNPLCFFVFAVCTALVLPVQEVYKRLDAKAKEEGGGD